MTNLNSILKSRDITLPTKVCLVKAMVFPVVMYGCESWTIKKAEHRRIDAFELWCWRRFLRVTWTVWRSNPVHPKGDQSWGFCGRTDAEAETLDRKFSCALYLNQPTVYIFLYVSLSFSLIKPDKPIYIYVHHIIYLYIYSSYYMCIYTVHIFSNHWRISCRPGMTYPKYFSIYFSVFPEYRTFSYIIQNKNQTRVVHR